MSEWEPPPSELDGLCHRTGAGGNPFAVGTDQTLALCLQPGSRAGHCDALADSFQFTCLKMQENRLGEEKNQLANGKVAE